MEDSTREKIEDCVRGATFEAVEFIIHSVPFLEDGYLLQDVLEEPLRAFLEGVS